MKESLRFRQFPEPVEAWEWIRLSSHMQKESTILNTRTTPDQLAIMYDKGLALVLQNPSEIIGFMVAWPVADGYVELGSAWIHEDFRGQGMGVLLYKQARNLPGLNDNVVFAITQNPVALKAGLHAGLHTHDDWTHPVPWKLTCDPCDLFPTDEEKHICPRRNLSCWLRIRRT